jgi:hypothetical protein
MKKIALPASLALTTVLAAPAAFAQNCPPGSWLCADVQINTGGDPQPPVVVQQPPVVVQQPPVVVQPPTVYYQPPPPPPTIVYQPRVVVTTAPAYTTYQTTGYSWVGLSREQAFGIAGHVGGAFLPSQSGTSSSAGMWGAGGALRWRSHPWLATELSFDVYAGRDYNGDSRAEVPFTLNELFYLNPQNRFQFYGLVGLGLSWAQVTHDGGTSGSTVSTFASPGGSRGSATDNYGYIGGQLGFGAEWQITPHFSLYSDIRGFLRTRIDQNTNSAPEFTRVTSSGQTQTSNTSVGSTFQLGALLYF